MMAIKKLYLKKNIIKIDPVIRSFFMFRCTIFSKKKKKSIWLLNRKPKPMLDIS